MRSDRILKSLLRHRFLVTTHKGLTWEGVLFELDDRTLVLHDASAIGSGGTHTKADSQVLIPRVDVAYLQRM